MRQRGGRNEGGGRSKGVVEGGGGGGRERGNGPNESMNEASEQSPKSIPEGTGTPAAWWQGRRQGVAEGGVAGVGFVRPRQWSRGQLPRRYHLSQLLFGFRTLRTGRLVNPILVHSPARSRLSVAPVPSVLTRSPSLTRRHATPVHPLHHRYTRVSRVTAAGERDFFLDFRGEG